MVKQLIARVHPELHRQVMILAAEQGRTLQELVVEAITDLLKKYGK